MKLVSLIPAEERIWAEENAMNWGLSGPWCWR